MMGVPTSLAQGGVSITPLISDLDLSQGNSYQRNIRIRSVDDTDLQVDIEVFDVQIDHESHAVSFLPEESKQNTQKSLASWIQPFGEQSFVLESGSERTVSYQIVVPENAPPGNYYASVNFYYAVSGEREFGNVQVRQSIGSLVLVNVGGDNGTDEEKAQDERDFEVSDLTLSPNGEDTRVWVDFTNNTLRYVHLKPQLTIRDTKGEVYYQKQGKSKRVFPGQSFAFQESFPNTYMQAVDGLELEYALWDKQQDEKYFEQKVSLGGLGTGFSEFWMAFSSWMKSGIVIAAGVLLLIALVCFVRCRYGKKFKNGKRK